jgi:hypothetical protein
MLPGITPELQEAIDLGIVLYAGAAEAGQRALLCDAARGALPSVYNHMANRPNLAGVPIPYLPPNRIARTAGHLAVATALTVIVVLDFLVMFQFEHNAGAGTGPRPAGSRRRAGLHPGRARGRDRIGRVPSSRRFLRVVISPAYARSQPFLGRSQLGVPMTDGFKIKHGKHVDKQGRHTSLPGL